MKYFLSLGMAGLLLAGCGFQKTPKKTTPPPVPVEVYHAERQTVPVEIPAVGLVEPLSIVQLKPKVGGEIESVEFADGAYVKKGQILFRIDPRPFDAAYRRAEANLAMVQAQSKNAEDQLRRYTTLSTKGAASQEQFAQYVSTAQQQKAELDARQADVDAAKLSLDWTVVRSPIDGRAGAALVKAGNIVQANTEVLAVINQLQPTYVTFAISEKQLDDVRKKLEQGALPVLAADPESGKMLQEGTVSFVDNRVDSEAGMVTLKATFSNESEALWPGQFVDVSIRLDEEKDALVVPATAVLDSQKGPRVFVVRDGVAELRDVAIGRSVGSLVTVRSGLAAGDSVVTSGQLRLKAGSKVVAKLAPPVEVAQTGSAEAASH